MTGIAVVTGASRGVGAACAVALAEDGHDLVLVHRRDHAAARTVAAEERPFGVRVNIAAPGLVDTELGRRFVRAAHGIELDQLAPLLPYGRACTAADVAAVVRWLASPGAAYLSGEIIQVNGGDDTAASDVDGPRAPLAAREQEELTR